MILYFKLFGLRNGLPQGTAWKNFWNSESSPLSPLSWLKSLFEEKFRFKVSSFDSSVVERLA